MLLRKATREDLSSIILTNEDYKELKAHDNTKRVDKTLIEHLDDNSVVLEHQGSILCYGGNSGDMVWFVTTTLVSNLSREERKEFLLEIIKYRDIMLSKYPTIWNYVWSGNKGHHELLKKIGAKFHNEYTKSPLTGEVFQLFTIKKEV